MYEQITAASNAYLDLTLKIANLCWGSSQRLAKLQTETGVRIFTESADSLKDTLIKHNGDQSLPEWNSLYINSANKVFDITRNYLEEVNKMRAEVAQVMDTYANVVAQQISENTDHLSSDMHHAEKSPTKTRKAA